MLSFEVSVSEPTFDSDSEEDTGSTTQPEPAAKPPPKPQRKPLPPQQPVPKPQPPSQSQARPQPPKQTKIPTKPAAPLKPPPPAPVSSPPSASVTPPSSSSSTSTSPAQTPKIFSESARARLSQSEPANSGELPPMDDGRQVSFRHNFWGSDPAACFNAVIGNANATSASDKEGMDLLERVTGVSVDSLQEMVTFMQERAEAEEQYSKRMRKLAGVPEGQDEGLGTALGVFKDDISSGMRVLVAEVVEEARQQFLAHKALAKSYDNAAASLREFLKNYKAARKTLLGEASAATKEKMQLESILKKQKAKYVETVTRKDSAMAAVSTLEQQGRSAQDISKQRAKAQKCAKEEMMADQELKEAVDKLGIFYPTWISRMQSMMDGLQIHEQKRLQNISSTLLQVSNSYVSSFPSTTDIANQIVESSVNLDSKHELLQWVSRSKTGSTPSLPPVYLPRANRTRLVDAISDATVDSAPVSSSASCVQRSCSLFDIGGAAASALSNNSEITMAGDLFSSQRSVSESMSSFSSCVTPSVTSSGTQTARVVKRFIGDDPDEIDLLLNDTVTVISTCPDVNNGWWIGRNRGRIGWFPSSFVELTAV